jgi:hypothetical protein
MKWKESESEVSFPTLRYSHRLFLEENAYESSKPSGDRRVENTGPSTCTSGVVTITQGA